MATGEPPMDPFNPIIEAFRVQCEKLAFPDGGYDDYEDAVGPLYNDGFKRPYVCVLMADVLSGRWKLGTTRNDVSGALGITKDDSWVSRAWHYGDPFSFDVYMRLRNCPTRPVNWEPDVVGLYGDMHRCGFLTVARDLAARVTSRPTLAPQRLNELNHELICEIFARLGTWMLAYAHGNEAVAKEIVANVCLDQKRNVNPTWCADGYRRQIESEIKRLTSDSRAAFEHLSQLQRDWLDVYVGTWVVVEGVKWRNP